MSGPKLSAAELERLRQEQLERERQEALRRLKEAQGAYRQSCNRVFALKDFAEQGLADLDPQYRTGAVSKIQAILAAVTIDTVADQQDTDGYLQAARAIDKRVDQATPKLEALLAALQNRAQADQKLHGADIAHQTFQAFATLQEDPVAVTKIDFQSHYDQKVLEDQIRKLYRYFQGLAKQGRTPDIQAFALKASDTIKKLAAHTADATAYERIRRQLQAMVNEAADMVRKDQEFQDLYGDYLALAAILGITPRDPQSFGNAESLLKEIVDLQEQYRTKDEMDYIADQINSVMIDLGYGMVSSRVLVRKDRSEMDYSLYQADDATGIAVYTDQSGAVMMRMTVLGDSEDITEEDLDFSYQRQLDFCAGHQDLVDALAERGVYLKQKSYLAPDKKYTYKVKMDQDDLATKDADGQTVLKKQKVNRRKRRRGGDKKVRTM